MSKITKLLLWLLLYLTIALNLDQIQVNGQTLIELHPLFHFFTGVVVILCLIIFSLRQMPQPLLMLTFSIVYIALRLTIRQNVVSPGESDRFYGIILELALMNLGVFLAHRFTQYLSELEDLINTSILGQSKRQIFDLNQVSDMVEGEFNRGRRYNYPISALIIDSKVDIIGQVSASPSRVAEDIAQRIRTKYLSARLTKSISEQIRQSDMIVRLDKGSKVLVLFPETPPENARMLANRLQDRAIRELGVSFTYGIASFPQDALTFRAVLNKAESELSAIAKTERELSSQSKQQSLQPK